jgi:hypothetical protein
MAHIRRAIWGIVGAITGQAKLIGVGVIASQPLALLKLL